ncbi:MAG TPA: BON domain-containing protein [Rhodopila sp.]|nr:BON domain-containing protein [Rhodopila sp.]
MTETQDVLDAVRQALHSEPRVHATEGPIHLAYADGELTMEGEVDHIAGKKLGLEAAAKVPGVSRIIDRLRVQPATPMGDGEIRDKVRDALLEETSLASCAIRAWVKGQPEIARAPADAIGTIDIRVEDGVVTLDGDVTGLGQKRMAGVLAWWVPGSRDVINGIGITPPEQDSEAAITDAVLQVLEKDPFVDAGSIRVHTRRSVVTLDGTVPREAERKLAEDDAWYVFGVDRVVNRLTTQTWDAPQ